jgi:hypothetical protein
MTNGIEMTDNIKTWPEKLFCRSELGTDYWTAHLTQAIGEVEYLRFDLVQAERLAIVKATLDYARGQILNLEDCWPFNNVVEAMGNPKDFHEMAEAILSRGEKK